METRSESIRPDGHKCKTCTCASQSTSEAHTAPVNNVIIKLEHLMRIDDGVVMVGYVGCTDPHVQMDESGNVATSPGTLLLIEH